MAGYAAVKPINQINVIPFIDVMLVLLAIVLTSATFIAQGTIPVNLPQADHATMMSEQAAVEIVIDKSGRVHWDGLEINEQRLGEQLAGLGMHDRIILRVDAATRFENFVGVIDRLKGMRLHNVSVVTQAR